MFENLAAAQSALGPVTWTGVGAFLLRVTMLAALAHLAIACMPRASAAARHQVALAALTALLVLPFASALLPAIRVPLLPARADRTDAFDRVAPAAGGAPAHVLAEGTPAAASRRDASPSAPPRLIADLGPGWLATPSRNAVALVLLAALVVAVALIARGLLAMSAAARIAANATVVQDHGLLAEFRSARSRLGLRRPVGLRETDRLTIPVVWGVFRPVLLLPAGASAWPRERRRAVLLHELAHVARHDGIALLATRAASALFWFHPLVVLLAGIARRECEHACDDIVLAGGERASDYAEHLVAIAQDAWSGEPLGGVAPAFARSSKLENRVLAILDPDARRTPASRTTFLGIALAALIVGVPIATTRVVAAPGRTESNTPVGSAPTVATVELVSTRSGERWYELARDRYSDERYDEAAAAYLEAAAARYRTGTALYNAACSYALAGRNDAAIATLERALDAGFDDPDLVASDDDLDALRSDPRFVRLAGRATTPERAERKRLSAVREFDALRAEDSQDQGEWRSVGIHLMRMGEFGRATQAFEAEYAIEPSASAVYNMACVRALAGDRKGALDLLERAIFEGYGSSEHMVTDADLRSVRGEPRFRELQRLADDLELNTSPASMGSRWGWRTAVPRYERIANAHPTIGRAWFNLGYARVEARDPDGALEALHKALDLGYRVSTTSYNIACACAQLGRRDEAFSWLDRAETAGMDVWSRAAWDDDLASLRSDPRFRAKRSQWETGKSAAKRMKHENKD